MDQQQDYIRDISEIRTMMERSSKFLSLSGWAGIMAGIYALAGAYVAYDIFEFEPGSMITADYYASGYALDVLPKLVLLGVVILALAVITAYYLSYKKALRRNEKMWNATSRRLLVNMMVPLVTGGLLILILLYKGFAGLVAPLTLIFYGLSLYIASKFTYDDIKILGLVNIALGLIAACYIGYGLLFWALGFGIGHIVYGMYVHFKYER